MILSKKATDNLAILDATLKACKVKIGSVVLLNHYSVITKTLPRYNHLKKNYIHRRQFLRYLLGRHVERQVSLTYVRHLGQAGRLKGGMCVQKVFDRISLDFHIIFKRT